MTDTNQIYLLNQTEEANNQPELSDEEFMSSLEAILFAAGYPVGFDKIAAALSMDEDEVRTRVGRVSEAYNSAPGRGIQLLVLGAACQICTKEKHIDAIRLALGIKGNGKLSAGSLEVLAIIAYNQPVTKAYIEQVRGVDCSYAIGMLCDRGMIAGKGRLDAPGRPILYGTTEDFLRCFGLKSIDELPDVPRDSAEDTPKV